MITRLIACLSLAPCGCVGPRVGADSGLQSESAPDAAGRDARRTALRNYARAALFRPEPSETRGPTTELAPLLVAEVTEDDTWVPACADEADGGSVEAAPIDQGCVYVAESATRRGGRERDQLVFAFSGALGRGQDAAASWRSVRLTLGADGFPIVWELSSSSDDEEVFFVSQSFEDAAARQFGAPPAGRRFSSERSIDETPGAVVARVLEDGPVPMGPYLYISADRREIDGVLCRCMPAQFDESVATRGYQLRPIEALGPAGAAMLKEWSARRGPPDRLRWPEGF